MPFLCFPALFMMILLSGGLSAKSEETLFANYFDIPVGSDEGTEVSGRIHLERNKDVRQSPVPAGYHFEIVDQEKKLFRIETRFDPSNRIMGVFMVDSGQHTGSIPVSYQVTVALKNKDQVLKKSKLRIHIVEQTLWTTLYQRYKDLTVSDRGSRMYGGNKFSDKQIHRFIEELEKGNGRFAGVHCYDRHPSDYLNEIIVDPVNERRYATIEHEWEKVASMIGGLGYAYAKSDTYGPNGNITGRKRLRKALYSAILAYTSSVPVEGDDILLDGKPLGPHTGDGFIRLSEHGLVSHALATHHWRILDPLVAPAVNLMPDLLEEIKNGDRQAVMVHHTLIRYYQIAMSVILSRRAIDNPEQRWGMIADTVFSEGAWADANLGHRLRVILALPIIWADYNRPMTYVPYWYSDFYGGTPFRGFSFSPGWSPHGVVPDVQRWLKKFYLPAHRFKQSGFHPDGTVSHHTGHASDAVMLAYGFAWLTEAIVGFNQFKNTAFQLGDNYYQFPADRIIRVYGKLFFKGQLDFAISGRSFMSDMDKFRENTFLPAIGELIEAKSSDTRIQDETKLLALHDALEGGTHEYSGTNAYWVNEFLVHRRGENGPPFYASVKLKSERVLGAEDFGPVRRSWHAGSGVLQLRVTGDEYTPGVLNNFDWHMLPGITEEWRTDPMPTEGGAQASLPGSNTISGVLADGINGMAIYHHLPAETYSSATALKSYYFVENKIIALGSNIQRYRDGQQRGIYTCIDQSSMGNSELTYSINGRQGKTAAGESRDMRIPMQGPAWVHHRNKGYFIFPRGQQDLIIQTGENIAVTDITNASDEHNFILTIGHGVIPGKSSGNQYHYVLMPNIKLQEMPAMLTRIGRTMKVQVSGDSIHSVYTEPDGVTQVAFFKRGSIQAGKKLEIRSSAPAMVIMDENKDSWTISVGDPTADPDLEIITLHVSTPLQEGTYDYQMPGVYTRPGETATVSADKGGSRIVIEMPDKRDEAYYNYQAALYAGAPVIFSIPKQKFTR